jgi:hypothetical protein
MTTEADALILRYLQELEAELHDLPANRRQELLDEVVEHIAAARAELDPETEARVRTMLERLGDPADIAAEARERFGVQPPPTPPATPRLEIAALVLLVIPFLGWVVRGPGVAVAALDHRRQARRHHRRAELGGGRAGRHHDVGRRVNGGWVGAAGTDRDERARGRRVRGPVRPAGGRRHLPRDPAALAHRAVRGELSS